MDEIKSVTVVAEDVVVQSGDLSLQALGSELPTCMFVHRCSLSKSDLL